TSYYFQTKQLGQDWLCTQSSSSSASPEDFPSVPQGLVPPSLESLSCTSLNSGQDLLGKAVQGKVCTLVQIVLLRARPLLSPLPDLHILEEKGPIFVAHFYRGVAGTASRDY
uniref:Uncharacterized protein n=1 Tax=Salmo trutta TaxID=8032 RepID=A0A673ZBF8_SALTR